MKKTLQDQYLLIKEGKGHTGVFLSEAKRQFADLIPVNADLKLTTQILKDKNIINENIVGLQAINQMIPTKKESFETAFETFLKEAKKKEETDKAEAKAVSKSVEKKQEHAHDNTDEKNIDNVIFDQVMMGYYAEMKDPKNADKTMEELKAIVLKNLAKDPIHYTKEGQFGIKGLGYTDEFPGLGKTKEVKGKYTSSGMEPVKLNENKQTKDMSINESKLRNVIRTIIREELNAKRKLSLRQIDKKDKKGLALYQNIEKPDDLYYYDGKVLYSVVDGNRKGPSVRMSLFNITGLKENLGHNETYSITPEGRFWVVTWSDMNGKKEKVFTSEEEARAFTTSLNENVHKRLKEIDGEVANEVTQSKLNKVQEEIEKRQAQLNMLDENEDLKDLTDGKKIKALQKEIKLLEKAKAKLEKSMKGKKKEVLDETENVDEASPEYMAAKQDAESRYNDGEDIETIIADYPQFKRELYNDVIGGFEGMDY
jgi:hypothetical protein